MSAQAQVSAELPGAELVVEGLADLAAGRETASAAAVAMASSRLRATGIEIPAASWSAPASHRLYELLGRRAHGATRLYLTGGATAVLEGWRPTTVDIDVRIEPESDELLRAISELKESLDLNIELASPADFLPELPGWRERSRFRFREGSLEVFELYRFPAVDQTACGRNSIAH